MLILKVHSILFVSFIYKIPVLALVAGNLNTRDPSLHVGNVDHRLQLISQPAGGIQASLTSAVALLATYSAGR